MKRLLLIGFFVVLALGLCTDITKDSTYYMPRMIMYPTDTGMHFIYRNHPETTIQVKYLPNGW